MFNDFKQYLKSLAEIRPSEKDFEMVIFLLCRAFL